MSRWKVTRVPGIPRMNTGAKTWAAGLIRLHSLATLTAVRGLSPVIIVHAKCAVLRVWMAGVVPGFNLFSKMISPRKRRLDSACSLMMMMSIIYRIMGSGDQPFHFLSFEPRQVLHTLARNGDDAISSPGVVRQQIVIVVWN